MGSHSQSPPGPTTGLQIHLLGGFAVEVEDRAVPDGSWRLRKAKTLVKLLVLAPQHRLHREQVIGRLWPDRDPSAAANNLHQVLHVARRQLSGAGDAGRRLRLEDDVLSLSSDEPIWIDAEAFRDQAAAALRSGDPQAARAALELYRGELLPEDLYEEWTEPARGELDHLREELELLTDGDGAPQDPAPARHDNLPSELSTFIGRESALDEVAGLLRRGPLLTLAGAAGCGKTRLAVETAARQRATVRGRRLARGAGAPVAARADRGRRGRGGRREAGQAVAG